MASVKFGRVPNPDATMSSVSTVLFSRKKSGYTALVTTDNKHRLIKITMTYQIRGD